MRMLVKVFINVVERKNVGRKKIESTINAALANNIHV